MPSSYLLPCLYMTKTSLQQQLVAHPRPGSHAHHAFYAMYLAYLNIQLGKLPFIGIERNLNIDEIDSSDGYHHIFNREVTTKQCRVHVLKARPPLRINDAHTCVYSHVSWTSAFAFGIFSRCISRSHSGGRPHRNCSIPLSLAVLKFYREKDSATPFPRRQRSPIWCVHTPSTAIQKVFQEA